LLLLASHGVQRAEAMMAVGHKRAHPQLVSQGEGLLVVGFGCSNLWGIVTRSNLTQEPQGPRFVSPLLVLAGKGKGALTVDYGVLSAPGEQIGRRQVGNPERLEDDLSYGDGLCHALFQQRQALGDTPGQRIGTAQG
jgi:hypothetical protein